MPTPGPRRASALPSVQARLLAFAAIVLAGLAGAAIGGSVVNIECHGSCDVPVGAGAVIGGAGAAAGTGVVAALTLRAMGEWRRISDEELAGEESGREESGTGPGGRPRGGAGGGGPDDGGPDDGDQDGVNSRNPSA